MKKHAAFSREYNDHLFLATVYMKDEGLIVDIEGPNDHMGGIGVGVPYIRKDGSTSANSHVISMPEHRDGEVAGSLAQKIAKITQRNTLLILGIHLDSPTKQDLVNLIHFLESWVVDFASKLNF